jgi:hypothetical protein
MKNEIELLNQTEADLLMLMQQYKSGQYTHLADCIRRVRAVRETLRLLTKRADDVARCRCGGEYYTDKVFGEVCCRCQAPRN